MKYAIQAKLPFGETTFTLADNACLVPMGIDGRSTLTLAPSRVYQNDNHDAGMVGYFKIVPAA